MLPVTPPDEHGSPYASSSAFAGWTGLSVPGTDYSLDLEEFENWTEQNLHWLEDWALYAVLKEDFDGLPWTEWPAEIRDRDPEAIAQIKDDLSGAMNIRMRCQFIFNIDWGEFRRKAMDCGVRLFGDLPFFVAHDSSDVWANRDLFRLEESGAPAVVAGVPPDYFSQEGQRWGTVHYDWDSHRANGFFWWKGRMERMFQMFDIIRIDHFRAIDSAWAIPAHHTTAEHGEWVKGPGDEFLEAILEVSPRGGLVAEDLGIIPDSVVEMRRRYGIPGMAVLQFGFDDASIDGDSDGMPDPANPNHPANIGIDQVAYTGTHDNDTTAGWWDASPAERRRRVERFAAAPSGPVLESGGSESDGSPTDTLIRLALASPAHLAIIPVQDIAGLGSEARMNRPGTEAGNWRWRLEAETPTDADWQRFADRIRASGRT